MGTSELVRVPIVRIGRSLASYVPNYLNNAIKQQRGLLLGVGASVN
jgi:hypothetical protein